MSCTLVYTPKVLGLVSGPATALTGGAGNAPGPARARGGNATGPTYTREDSDMKFDDIYPSRYLKADTREVPEEGTAVFTIDDVRVETLGQGKDAQKKPVLYFIETSKALVLNKTNFGLIARALGSDDTDYWTGRSIALYSADVQFGGEMTRGIRVVSKAPRVSGSPTPTLRPLPIPAPAPAPVPATAPDPAGDDEECPF